MAFGLTRRRPIVLLALLAFLLAVRSVFIYGGWNIEAYPNPAPVILEITAQAPGQSAEEMERYYTIPIEVGLAATPGIDIIRSTSFYGLLFVRVTFKYGTDYYFALQQTAIFLAAKCQPTEQRTGADPRLKPSWRGLIATRSSDHQILD